MKNILILLVLSFFSFSNIYADHILSGNIGYECLGNDEYEFTIEIERDCFSAGADFDGEIVIGVYHDGFLYQDLIVQLGQVWEIFPEDYEDCMSTQFDFCREKANYIFRLKLPKSDKAYTISYQRCCWSGIIGNIRDVSANGITITTDLTPLAQSICNNQEISSSPISFLACPNTDVNIALPMIDEEGDSLVYDVCLPYNGGGRGGTMNNSGSPYDCDGVTPEPACPPPYEEIEYAAGFSDSNPFPTKDGFIFEDGMLQFTPNAIGHFLSGLCISEYRNGVLLSRKHVPLAVISDILEPNNIEEETTQSWKITALNASFIELKSEADFNEVSCTIFDVSGRNILINQTTAVNSIRADIGHLTAGIYIIEVQEKTESHLIRFFKPY